MAAAENHLIELLPHKDAMSLLALCEAVPLLLGQVLGEPGDVAHHVYFPTEGFILLVAMVDGHAGLEVGMVGREGMLGAQLALGVAATPLRALVQGDGKAWRVSAADFRRELARGTALRRCLNRYVHVLMSQLTCSAACLRYHQIGPRLARLLLMSQDRAYASHFRVTQEFLGCMLGVRRVGVTAAAGRLQSSGLIEYHRGAMTVLDRPGLEAAACGCYAANQRVYASLLT